MTTAAPILAKPARAAARVLPPAAVPPPLSPPSAQPTPSPARPCDVLTDLRAKRAAPAAPGVLSALAWSAATVGIAPAVLWPMRFRQAAEADGRTFRGLADWAAAGAAPADARELQRLAAKPRFVPWLFTLALVAALAAAVAVVWGLTHTGGRLSPLDRLLAQTFGYFWPKFQHVVAGRGDWALAFTAWSAGLTVAYVCHLVQVHLYAHRVRRFLDALNHALVDRGAPPAYLKPIGWGFSPLWVAAAFVLVMFAGGVWGVPLAVAGATDRRLRRKAVPRLRAALCERVRAVALGGPTYHPRQPARSPTGGPTVRCSTPGCPHRLRPAAKFCPRCGQRRRRGEDD